MKSRFFFIVCIFIILIHNSGSAQSAAYSQLVDKVKRSDIVVEGKIIETKYFNNKPKNGIFTSAIIRLSKVFKGNFSDTIIELVFDGGIRTDTMPDGTIQEVGADISNSFYTQKGDEGIFLLKENNTGHKLVNGVQSYIPRDEWISYIAYSPSKKKGEPYSASCIGGFYQDAEKDLLEVIEATTGQPRKVLRLNSFEQQQFNK